MIIERKWAMPSAWTFTIKPIRDLLKDEVVDGVWVDPFGGDNSPAQHTNDINPARKTGHHMDALDFLKTFSDASVDGVILDPPYSPRQISEHYKQAGIRVTGWHTSMGWRKEIKDEAHRILKPKGKVICFGWNSMGLGLTRGYIMTRLLLVPHGGAKNDTICTVEVKN